MEVYELFKKCLTAPYKTVEESGSYYVEKRENALFLYFECSNGKEDWKNNFDFPVKPYRDMKDKWYCHRGFLKVWKAIEPYIAEVILNPEIDVIVSIGYSHGGAIAQLCHEYCKFHRPDCLVEGFGFGSPRVLWGVISENVRERFNEFLIIRNGRDIVTHLPPKCFGFRDVAKIVEIGNKNAYNCIEAHYPNVYEFELYTYVPFYQEVYYSSYF